MLLDLLRGSFITIDKEAFSIYIATNLINSSYRSPSGNILKYNERIVL